MGCMRDWHTAVCGICTSSVAANRLSWAASETGIQLCVSSVAVQLWQTDCHGLHERLPWLVQHSCFIWTQIILVIHQRREKHSSYIMVQWTSHSASKCVLHSVCVQSNNVAVGLYWGNKGNVADDCVILVDKKYNYDSSDVSKYLT